MASSIGPPPTYAMTDWKVLYATMLLNSVYAPVAIESRWQNDVVETLRGVCRDYPEFANDAIVLVNVLRTLGTVRVLVLPVETALSVINTSPMTSARYQTMAQLIRGYGTYAILTLQDETTTGAA